MSMLQTCAAEGCETRTLGHFCSTHEAPRPRDRPRRPERFFLPSAGDYVPDEGRRVENRVGEAAASFEVLVFQRAPNAVRIRRW